MPIVEDTLKVVKIEAWNLGRFATESAKRGHVTLAIRACDKREEGFAIVSGIPFETAKDIAIRMPSMRDETHTEKPDPNVDVDGNTPENGAAK